MRQARRSVAKFPPGRSRGWWFAAQNDSGFLVLCHNACSVVLAGNPIRTGHRTFQIFDGRMSEPTAQCDALVQVLEGDAGKCHLMLVSFESDVDPMNTRPSIMKTSTTAPISKALGLVVEVFIMRSFHCGFPEIVTNIRWHLPRCRNHGSPPVASRAGWRDDSVARPSTTRAHVHQPLQDDAQDDLLFNGSLLPNAG